MRVLILADIHSNWRALQAIEEEFDACLCLGDLVDYGTDPVPCLDWVRRHATAAVRGNHDHAVAQRVPPKGGGGYKQLAAATRPLHWDLIDPAHLAWLARLPVTQHVTLEEQTFFLVHGTPRDPLDEYLPADPLAWQNRLEGVEADFVCVGHTHIPFHLKLDGVQVINPGSVGQPRDGDPRCSYAVVEDGAVALKRVEYDIDATLRQMSESGLDRESLALAEKLLREGGFERK